MTNTARLLDDWHLPERDRKLALVQDEPEPDRCPQCGSPDVTNRPFVLYPATRNSYSGDSPEEVIPGVYCHDCDQHYGVKE